MAVRVRCPRPRKRQASASSADRPLSRSTCRDPACGLWRGDVVPSGLETAIDVDGFYCSLAGVSVRGCLVLVLIRVLQSCRRTVRPRRRAPLGHPALALPRSIAFLAPRPGLANRECFCRRRADCPLRIRSWPDTAGQPDDYVGRTCVDALRVMHDHCPADLHVTHSVSRRMSEIANRRSRRCSISGFRASEFSSSLHSRYKLIIIRFFQQFLNLFGRFGLLQKSAERVVAQLA